MAKSNATATAPAAAATAPMGHADVFALVAVLSALPWGVRVKAMNDALMGLTPEGIDSATARFKAYHEGVLAKMQAGGITGPLLTAQWEVVSAIRDGSSAIVQLAEKAKERKAKLAKETAKANAISTGTVPAVTTPAIDPEKV